MSRFKIGMRTVKTVIAIALAMVMGNLLRIESPFIMALTAFFCLQSTIVESSEMAVKRGGGTLVGGAFSLFFLGFFPTHPFFIPLGILLIIVFCNGIGRNDFIPMAGVVFLVISFKLYAPIAFEPVQYVISRVSETFIGIGIAIIVNRFIKPPNPYAKLEEVCEELIALIDAHITHRGELLKIRNIEAFRLKLHDYRQLLQLCHKEKMRKKYNVDLEYYVQQMQRFRSAYSHFYIINDLNSEDKEAILAYHQPQLGALLESIKTSAQNRNIYL